MALRQSLPHRVHALLIVLSQLYNNGYEWTLNGKTSNDTDCVLLGLYVVFAKFVDHGNCVWDRRADVHASWPCARYGRALKRQANRIQICLGLQTLKEIMTSN